MDSSRSPGSSAGSMARAGSSGSTPDLSQAAPAARTQARELADTLTQEAKQAAQTTTRAVKAQASEFTADVGQELNKLAEQQKARGTEAIRGFARAINAAAAELQGQAPLVSQYVREAAGRVQSLSGSIDGRNVSELMKAASELARSQPMLFFGGAVAAGFVLSRFLKSSAKEDQLDHSTSPDLSPM